MVYKLFYNGMPFENNGWDEVVSFPLVGKKHYTPSEALNKMLNKIVDINPKNRRRAPMLSTDQ